MYCVYSSGSECELNTSDAHVTRAAFYQWHFSPLSITVFVDIYPPYYCPDSTFVEIFIRRPSQKLSNCKGKCLISEMFGTEKVCMQIERTRKYGQYGVGRTMISVLKRLNGVRYVHILLLELPGIACVTVKIPQIKAVRQIWYKEP